MRVLRRLLCLLMPLFMAVSISACHGAGSAGDNRRPGLSTTRIPATPALGDLPTTPAAELPAEARRTLLLIDQNGPFPYRKDGAIFQNREGKLPSEPRGFYREYTVPTPGSPDRGARRLIAGKEGERYYTGDHYRSFVRVMPR